jgi:hypothetical protein
MEEINIEIKDFEISWNGLSWIIKCEEPKVIEYIYLPITQIIKMLHIENISTEEFDKCTGDYGAIKFKKVVLLMEFEADGEVCYSKMFEPTDSESYGFEMIETKIKE